MEASSAASRPTASQITVRTPSSVGIAPETVSTTTSVARPMMKGTASPRAVASTEARTMPR